MVDRNDLEDQVAEYRRQAPREYWDTMGAMVSNLPEAHHSTTWIGDRAAESIQSWDGQGSHLLMVGFIKPHHPFDPPAPWHEMYDPQKLTLLPGWTTETVPRDFQFSRGYFPYDRLTEAGLRRVMAYYYANISLIDHQVGRLIALLKAKHLYDNTLIVFTADHGEYMGFHHMILKANHMYDPLVKVPLLIKWPGGRRAGTVSERLVSNVDLAPTLCRAAGLCPDAEMHGEDLAADGPNRQIVFCEQGPPVMARTRSGNCSCWAARRRRTCSSICGAIRWRCTIWPARRKSGRKSNVCGRPLPPGAPSPWRDATSTCKRRRSAGRTSPRRAPSIARRSLTITRPKCARKGADDP